MPTTSPSPHRSDAGSAWPILFLLTAIVFSFNNPKGRFNYTWQGFTLDNWRNWDAVPGLSDAMKLSLEIAFLSALLATALGTAIALALVRYLFRGRGRDEVLPWDIVDNGVSKGYYLRELDKSQQEKLSPHCPEIQGCIRCGVCVETPNPSYRLPEKWKALGTSPRYLKVAAS